MSTIEERTAYRKNPFFAGHIYGDFSPFYVTIAICTVIGISIIILNVICGCCSKYKDYWQDRHTGNRWLVSIWSATPHKQPPLDLTELKYTSDFQPIGQIFPEDIEAPAPVHQSHHHRPPRPEGRSIHQSRQREEYVELQKRESDI